MPGQALGGAEQPWGAPRGVPELTDTAPHSFHREASSKRPVTAAKPVQEETRLSLRSGLRALAFLSSLPSQQLSTSNLETSSLLVPVSRSPLLPLGPGARPAPTSISVCSWRHLMAERPEPARPHSAGCEGEAPFPHTGHYRSCAPLTAYTILKTVLKDFTYDRVLYLTWMWFGLVGVNNKESTPTPKACVGLFHLPFHRREV